MEFHVSSPQSAAEGNCSFAGPYDHSIPEQQKSMMQN